ncbi:patatin family protein [Clostridiaceae bacterium]|nr:patatin family protein [Clostridium sp.]NBI71075.1 patatin family protein [Clostridiaceae bacterium]
MRGIYTAGVLDVFLEHEMEFDGVIGVSAGAIHGCSFVSGQKGRSIRYYKKYCNDKRFVSFRNLILTGDIAGEQFCYHEIPERLDPYDFEAFSASKTEFYVTCSNVETGRAEHLPVTDMRSQVDLMRASASLPYASRIVRAGGMKLLDGACTDSIPVGAFHRMGFHRLVVIMTRPKGYVKKPERRWLPGIYYRRYPAFARALRRRHENYNRTVRQIERLEAAGKLFVIRPSRALDLKRTEHDVKKLDAAYALGREDALRRIGEMKRWLGGSCNA